MSTPRSAVGYTRVSTTEQAGNGQSLTAQRAKVEAYATMHDLELADVIEDAGHSAKTLDRPGMSQLLELIRRRKVGVVIVSKLDRITRSVRDLGELVDLFQRSGVAFASVAESIDSGTAAGRLVLNVMGSVAQWEREAIGERTAEVLADMRARGRAVSRHAPFGYRRAGDRWLSDHKEQEAIGIMLDLRARGASLREIAARLERRGYLSRSSRRIGAETIRRAIQAHG